MKKISTMFFIISLNLSNTAFAQTTLKPQGKIHVQLTELNDCLPPLSNIKSIHIAGHYKYQHGAGYLTISQINGKSIDPLTLEPLGLSGKYAFGYFTATPLKVPGVPRTTLNAIYVDISLLGAQSGNIILSNQNNSACQVSSSNFPR